MFLWQGIAAASRDRCHCFPPEYISGITRRYGRMLWRRIWITVVIMDGTAAHLHGALLRVVVTPTAFVVEGGRALVRFH